MGRTRVKFENSPTLFTWAQLGYIRRLRKKKGNEQVDIRKELKHGEKKLEYDDFSTNEIKSNYYLH